MHTMKKEACFCSQAHVMTTGAPDPSSRTRGESTQNRVEVLSGKIMKFYQGLAKPSPQEIFDFAWQNRNEAFWVDSPGCKNLGSGRPPLAQLPTPPCFGNFPILFVFISYFILKNYVGNFLGSRLNDNRNYDKMWFFGTKQNNSKYLQRLTCPCWNRNKMLSKIR